MNRTSEDAFNLLCGKLIGEGIHRKVFECRVRPDLVVKVETEDDWRYFSNVHEMKFWSDNQYAVAVAQWLAPCEYLAPDGRILLQRRVQSIRDTDMLPDKLPMFLTDIKRENFGWLNEKLVCVDYAAVITNASQRLRKVEW
jgi:hypothetical protein